MKARVTKAAPLAPKGVANGVLGGTAPASGDEMGGELVADDETGVVVALVVAVEDIGALEVAHPALVTGSEAVVIVADVIDIALTILRETSKIEKK